MIFKAVTGMVLGVSLAVIPAERAEADAGDFIAGAIIGGIVGANAKKQRRTRSTTRKTYRSKLPSTQEGKTIQASLNYFGFAAGAVDGQLGNKTRNAVSQYQAYLGYPVTGHLSPFEHNLLVSSYNRAQAGGQMTFATAAASSDGMRGLLKNYRREMSGQPSATVAVAAPIPEPKVKAPVVAAASLATASMLPVFSMAGPQASLASHCNTVSLVTNSNGGFVTQASLSDANVALNEQFCIARTYAIAKSEEMISQINGMSPDQVAQQCAGFAPVLKDHVAALSLKTREAVVADVSNFVLTSGMAPAQLSNTARVCMGVGYKMDNMDVAVGSALLLFAMGEGVYGELMGHHLAQGFGVNKRIDLAGSWYNAGLSAIDTGAVAVFNPGQPERAGLIRAAAQQLTGGGGQSSLPVLPQVQPASTGGTPLFSISE